MMRDVLNKEGVVENNNSGGTVFGIDSRFVLGVGGDISTLDILGRDVLGVEFNIVSGDLEGGEVERLVVEDGEVERLVVEDGEVAILESEVDKFENITLNDV